MVTLSNDPERLAKKESWRGESQQKLPEFISVLSTTVSLIVSRFDRVCRWAAVQYRIETFLKPSCLDGWVSIAVVG
jgi:hypothetical protein